jgi:hypothetical protein
MPGITYTATVTQQDTTVCVSASQAAAADAQSAASGTVAVCRADRLHRCREYPALTGVAVALAFLTQEQARCCSCFWLFRHTVQLPPQAWVPQ